MMYKSLNSKVRNHLEATAKGLAFYPSFKWKESLIMELQAQPASPAMKLIMAG